MCGKQVYRTMVWCLSKMFRGIGMKLIKGEYYWVKIDDMYGLETAQWNGNSWQCIGREWILHKNQVKPIEHIKKPDKLEKE